jgi:hypothetical protein
MGTRPTPILSLLKRSAVWGFVAALIFIVTVFIPGWNMLHYIIFMMTAAMTAPAAELIAALGITFPGKQAEILVAIIACITIWVGLSALRFTFLFSLRDLNDGHQTK